MPTIETPFLKFWRALDAELAKIGELAAENWEADVCAQFDDTSVHLFAAAVKARRDMHRPPSHQHNAGKTFR